MIFAPQDGTSLMDRSMARLLAGGLVCALFTWGVIWDVPWGGTWGTARADELTLLVHEPPKAAQGATSGKPPLIVLLHGAGADERDMIGLWHDLPASFVVVSPRAPFHGEGGGYRWYRKGPTQNADLAVSRKIVDLVVDNAIKRFDADPGRVFVGGFSQGAVMTYEVALREPGHFRGAAVLSGILFPSEAAELSGATDRSHEAFFVAHGTADPIIPYAAATSARAKLQTLGVPTDFHAYPKMGHTVGVEETRDLSAWLAGQTGRQTNR